jgi:catechol 2,3-dioxygenase-like lactoylglutathione lyase family enzyme
MAIGTTRLCHIAIIVKDLKKAMDNWSNLLGIEKPNVWKIPPSNEVPQFTHGKMEHYYDCQFAVFKLENVNIELIQPGDNSGPWKEALEKDGEGLQNLAFIVPDRKEAMKTLKEMDAPTAFHIGYWPKGTYSFTDTRKQLGVGINIKTDDDNAEIIKKLQINPELYKNDL